MAEEIKAVLEAPDESLHLETIAARDARIGELEQAVSTREGEIAALKEQLAVAAGKYRAIVLAGAPQVPEELITGATIEEVDASLATARSMVDKVKKQLEEKLAAERVPAGAPARTSPNLSELSPREKIAHALAH